MRMIFLIMLSISTFSLSGWGRRLKLFEYRILSAKEVRRMGFEHVLSDGVYVLTEGRIYLLKNAVVDSGFSDEEFLEKEVFIYKLAQRCSISNIAEVRIVRTGDLKGTELGKWLEERGFTIAILTRWVEEYEKIPAVRNPSWREELVAFWVFVRDFDHWVEGVDTNFYRFVTGGSEYGISYDNNRAMLVKPSDEVSNHVEGGSSALYYLISSPDLSYRRLSEVIERIVAVSEEEIRDIAIESGIPEEEINRMVEYLIYTRDNLFKDVESLVEEIRGEEVSLRKDR